MNQTPSTIDISEILQDEEQQYQSYIRQESTMEKKLQYSISANNQIKGIHLQDIHNKEGWLMKKSPKLLVGWQKRYVKIQDGKMQYYKGLDKFKGCVDFHLISVTITPIVKNNEIHEIRLELKGIKKIFQFKSLERNDLEDWYRCIQQHILMTQFYPKITPLNHESMWRFERISETYFKKKADTGDILLFRGQSPLSKIQRAFTGDNFDHVALLLRYNNGELFLFESMGQTGVSLLSWDTFMRNNWHTLYQQMVYRQLEVNRSNEFLEKLELFVKGSIGKRYQMSPSKLIKRFTKSSESIDDLEKEDKTFFCSELIAAAYKKMGIIDANRCAASYWPGIFAQNSKLQLTKGYLKQELLIDFSLV
ncbi:unnamed protein product (macronuclear) [Paramecium tetraurelia]|uniref:PH domain-containing protein n=1 Tax=Paramecium tetraurelia TaxID=5888 RepID=A0CUS1_PARTE|nr:uncharacterized protein GSPATT00010739001 [Paramecium tetraurelia]CAK74538.1 unnamed protein product [Paramecium tetraurelia]|eukprot:XP_001441935.1 hypothetical protein (macronuclear) [Paramecium tetraurelia strain d4-2]